MAAPALLKSMLIFTTVTTGCWESGLLFCQKLVPHREYDANYFVLVILVIPAQAGTH